MSVLEYILVFTFIGSIGALIGGLFLLSFKKFALKISHFLASFAAGVLLATAFFDLMPEAQEAAEDSGADIFLWTLIGILIFFLLERYIHYFHHHEDFHQDKEESKSTVPLIIIGDTMHNFLDGVVIATTFMINIPLGIVSTFAVFAHEVPQEIGDFGLLLHKGLSRTKVVWVNIVSAASAFLGAILAYILGGSLESYLPILLSLTAGFFIYIASSDLIPEIHYEKRKGFAAIESFLLILGAIIIYVAISSLEHGH